VNNASEPWHIELGFESHTIVDRAGNTILDSMQAGEFWKHVPRIVACINACAEICTEDLERGLVQDMLEERRFP